LLSCSSIQRRSGDWVCHVLARVVAIIAPRRPTQVNTLRGGMVAARQRWS
jgi:hypothetical protein